MRTQARGNGKGGKRKARGEADFVLEASAVPGEVPRAVIEELRGLCGEAHESASQYSEAVKLQAEKYKLKASALRRYVNALVKDNLEDVRGEAQQLLTLSDI